MRAEKLATVRGHRGPYGHLEAGRDGERLPGPGIQAAAERWRRLFSRVPALEREEVNILRGLLESPAASKK